MTVANNFLPLATGAGANVESQATYSTDPALGLGQQSGIAKSAFNNKALRQANSIVSQFAQYVANTNNSDVLDNLDTAPSQLLATMTAALQILPPDINVFTSGNGTFNPKYYLFCASANATAGAVYKDANNTEFTVVNTVSAALSFQASGPAAPALGTGGLTLTKFSGTGDTTISYYAIRAPLSMEVILAGGGGGGGSSSGATGAAGTNSTFGALTAAGGSPGASAGGAGGAVTAAGSSTLIILNANAGSKGGGGGVNAGGLGIQGGAGGANALGGAGGAGGDSGTGGAGVANTGAGGGGAGNFNVNAATGGGGGSGGYIKAVYLSPASSYSYSVGTGGTAGTSGGAGAVGLVLVICKYQ